MRFGLLGPLEVRDDGGETVRIPETRVRTLLAALLVREGRAATVDALIDDVWSGRRPASPLRVLRAKVSQLRTALATAQDGGRNRVRSVPGGYLLPVNADELDVLRFRTLMARARAADVPGQAVALLTEALDLWRGPALSDFPETPFAVAAAVRLTEERLSAVEERAEHRLRLGEHGPLADELRPMVEEHPLRERLLAVHMSALYRSGRQAEALEAYEKLRHQLAEELGADPGPDITTLHQDILRHSPRLATPPALPPRESALRPRSNLPAPVNRTIGRERETEQVRRLLRQARLVCLTGPGGVGKTRLALEAATGLDEEFPDGIRLVEFGALSPAEATVERVAETVAAGLEISDGSAVSSPEDLLQHLADRLRPFRMLLVLDNCEHAAEPVARLVHGLLRAAPGLRCLATSREPLRAEGEHVFEVSPLETGAGRPPVDLDSAPGAVRLFADRALAVAPDLRLDAEALSVVASVCHRLDGLPLALELAAHRVRVLGLPELSAHLDDRFGLLVEGHRALPHRQQTLRAVIDWSWDLLGEPERRVLCHLAVHSDGCTLEAAQAVAEGEEHLDGGVLAPLSRLVGQSLVSVQQTLHGPRYRLLESIAAYAAERLEESGQAEAARERHMRFYAGFAQRADPMLRSAEQHQWLQLMQREEANLRTAFSTAIGRRDTDMALVLASAPFWYRWIRGRLGEAHRLLAEALAMPGGSRERRAIAAAWHAGLDNMNPRAADPVAGANAALAQFDGLPDHNARARAKWFLGPALIAHRHRAQGMELLDQAVAELQEQGDLWGVAVALSNRAWLEQSRGNSPRHETDGRHALQLFRDLGDRWGQLQAMAVLSRHAEIDGDFGEASRIGRQALSIARELGLWPEVSTWLSSLAWCAVAHGDFEQARNLHEQASRLATEIGYSYGERAAELGSGMAAHREGRLEAADRHLRHWLEHASDIAGTVDLAMVFTELGCIAELRADTETALREHSRALTTALETGSLRSIARALEGLAATLAAACRARQAAHHLGTAAAARTAIRAKLPTTEQAEVERARSAAIAALGPEAYAEAYQHGRALDPRQASHGAVSELTVTAGGDT
ncbi:BTAD domain-containing putative transcriptional regulator [Nonomuraea sp. NPDC059023]|uniref:BTAD domain-containing putative transcriptional regulator n=1 Tax=unclassified Nonomuraea TaxID=2593643 RepID=UPI0036BFB398